MIRAFYFLLICAQTIAYGQLKTFPITQNSHNHNLRIEETESDTLELPFWDDFSLTGASLNNSLWESGENILINNSLAINPPSQYVVTFDGTTSNGLAYDVNTNFNGAGDSLVSQPINLSQIADSKRETVFLSFFWQLLGSSDLPEENDSLQLQFFGKDSTWIIQDIVPKDVFRTALIGGRDNIGLNADSIQTFQQIIVQVSGNEYFHKGFKFKFISYSSLNGIYDNWHLDYIYLNKDRSKEKTSYLDRNLSQKPSVMFDPYYEIPSYQFLTNPSLYQSIPFTTANNLDNSFHPLEYTHTIYNLTNGLSISSGDIVDTRLNPQEIGRKISGIAIDKSIITEDSTVIRSEFVYKTGDKYLYEVIGSDSVPLYSNVNLAVNDTLRETLTLYNYYAYDDGVADLAIGLNIIGGMIAVQFIIDSLDVLLTDILINFPSINPTSDGEPLDIIVWKSLVDNIQLARIGHVVSNTTRTGFDTISFNNPPLVQDTFYIGFQQYTENYVGVGFDKDHAGGTSFIFSNTNNIWEQNSALVGSMMIRPVVDNQDSIVMNIQVLEKNSIVIFPNPSTGIFHIEGNYDYINISDLSGHQVFTSKQLDIVDLSLLRKGIYLCQFVKDNNIVTKKIMIQ